MIESQNHEGDLYDTIAASLITQWGEGLRGYQAANLQQAIVNLAGVLKDSVRADFYKEIDAGLNKIFKVKSKEDQNK